jgi:hypothetical protein
VDYRGMAFRPALAEEWARSYSVKRILNLGSAVAPVWNCSSQRLTTFEAREQLESGGGGFDVDRSRFTVT